MRKCSLFFSFRGRKFEQTFCWYRLYRDFVVHPQSTTGIYYFWTSWRINKLVPANENELILGFVQ